MIVLSPGVGKKIESPIVAFNNLLLQISEQIEEIYYPNKTTKLSENVEFLNKLLFEEKSITIFGYIKLVYHNNNFGVKFNGVLDDFTKVQITIDNYSKLCQIFQNYLYIIQTTSINLDPTISQNHVQSLFEQISNNQINTEQYFILPFKNKIKHLYDFEKNDKTLETIFNRYSYVIKFAVENRQTFRYKFYRVLSSSLNESNSLENIRFEDIELLKKDIVSINKLQHFLVELFYYGNLN